MSQVYEVLTSTDARGDLVEVLDIAGVLMDEGLGVDDNPSFSWFCLLDHRCRTLNYLFISLTY